jgi:Bacteriophage T4-like capsid assembly protein (Gp20).
VEDATVIYRLSRAPERRVFYIDVGNMPTVKAEQYVRDIMVKYRNKLVYDSNTGEIKDDRKHLSMLEDFWLPRREGSKGTEISTLEGARNLGEMEDVKYFQSKLYRSLNVPIGRMEAQQGFSLGRTTEINRDEIKFNKFVTRLRNKFSTLFDDLLRVQLVLKRICTEEEWKEFKEDIWYDYKKDNSFDEIKDAELLNIRLDTLAKVDPFVGKYYSVMWVRKNILQQTDDDIEEINAQMQEEGQIQAQIDQANAEAMAVQQQQDMQNQIAFGAQQQIAQAVTQKEVDKIAGPDQGPSKSEKTSQDHESKMMDKKIALEKMKQKKSAPPAKAAKKKTVAEEAKDLGLVYVGSGKYANKGGEITHLNENGILLPYLNKD